MVAKTHQKRTTNLMHPRCHNPPHIQPPVLDFDGYAAHLWRDVLDVSVCEVQSLIILVPVTLWIACSVHEHPAPRTRCLGISAQSHQHM